ncbi:uncharacterized protein EV420DRAFT_603899 [Desarmillaria tabescens]|uniref:Uncharacterized protein n=1 Tax=Armillaria tabescens TaxID=1929756 RepID=A0AA39N1W9_ARMTA|nr:uncharacterized protein EV420DRAFT_603899 [Desarmillaria tabescens]KAK0454160.1 hypothetical protein EV420DRAFT_603899 [Desarmillaria tabescens]
MASSTPPLIPLPAPESEEMIDRFATLFSPPTPHASPTNTPPPSTFSILTDSPHSPDGEFGAFVFVPPSQDPLATTPFSPVHTEPHTTHAFFDEAKRAQERNKRDVLDELLLDEPLFRSKDLSPPPPPPPPVEIDMTSDMDDDFFSAKTSSLSSSLVSIAPSSRYRHSPPSRTSTLSAATPAPPIASTSSVSLPITPHTQTLPSRWMSTFLPPSSPSARATLDSLFDHHHLDPAPPRPHSVVPVEITHENTLRTTRQLLRDVLLWCTSLRRAHRGTAGKGTNGIKASRRT